MTLVSAISISWLGHGWGEKYRHIADRYDRSLGAVDGIRRQSVSKLALGSGDIILDIACGTGLSFPLLEEGIGPEGRIVGFDLSSEMLAKARDIASSGDGREYDAHDGGERAALDRHDGRDHVPDGGADDNDVRARPCKTRRARPDVRADLGIHVRGADTAAKDLTPESRGLEAIATGFQLAYIDDSEQLAAELPVYDALYAYCQNLVQTG